MSSLAAAENKADKGGEMKSRERMAGESLCSYIEGAKIYSFHG
jgi:hypothetical protein